MAETAGHLSIVEISDDDSSWAEIAGVTSISIGRDADMLDITDLADTTAAKLRMQGLKDGTIEISGNVDLADTDGQDVLRALFLSGDVAYIRVKLAGTGDTYRNVDCIVASYSESGDVEGVVEFTASLEFDDSTLE